MDVIEVFEKIKACKVLVVEESVAQKEQTLSLLSMFFDCVQCVQDGETALSLCYKEHFDLLICGIFLPKMSGIVLAQTIKKHHASIDIMFISSSTNVLDFKSAIRLRVVDFLMVPYRFDELKEALVRFGEKRVSFKVSSSELIELNDRVKYDNATRCLMIHNVSIPLTPKEQKLIQLASHFRNRVLTYDQISNALDDEFTNPTAIKNIILRLRKKLPTDIFENVMGVGYRVV